MTVADDRIFALDVLRGVAILAVALASAAAIALSEATRADPRLMGGGVTDMAAWLAGFVLIDGKLRALFAMLFGASALLVIDRAELDGRDGLAEQRRRLAALLGIGLLDHLLVWPGELLILLAVAGFIALPFVGREPIDLLKWALGLFALQLLILGGLAAVPFWTASASAWAEQLRQAAAADVALHQGGYAAMVEARLTAFPGAMAGLALGRLAEAAAFMLIGMAMAKGGFFMGLWARADYARTARHAYLVGIIPTAALGAWVLLSGDARLHGVARAGALPFAIPIAIGHAALVMLVVQRLGEAALLRRIAAIGRTALSNYLLTTIVLTSLCFGYGGGLYGRVGWPTIVGISGVLWAAMLLWSSLWLRRFERAPAEALWQWLRRLRLRAEDE